MRRFINLVLLTGLLTPLLIGAAGCAHNDGAHNDGAHNDNASAAAHAIHLAAASDISTAAQNAEPRVRDAYRFAAANPQATQNVPCFCGCAPLGHASNYDCYVQATASDGKIIFDDHALGCTICVDITQDVMRMTGEGRAPPQIRQAIINTYSRYGPSNQTR